jgi:hypothetical protein
LSQSIRKNKTLNGHQKSNEDKVSFVICGDITSIIISMYVDAM